MLTPSDRYSLAELAQMAIEGDCGWLVLPTSGMTDDMVREECAELVPLCKEAEVILTLTDRPELARDLGLHGVYLTSESGHAPAAVREELGPEAIIGVEISTAGTVKTLEAMDIDYAVLSGELPQDKCVELIVDAREGGAILPLVMQGAMTPAEGAEMRGLGATGLLVGRGISDAEDPVEAVREFLKAGE
ncbi:MAG: thiamine phosphate synthase [Muribaculaceae bacterium]|nr:thiamine phosphate synthase [Muribaculaceae bacterium]